MNILIIGGCGYIGSRLYLYLVDKFDCVDTLDTEQFGNYVNKKNIKKDFKNINPKDLQKYDVVIHLGGYSSVQLCTNNKSDAFTYNILEFYNLMRKLTNKQKFIYASSSSLYNGSDKETNEMYSYFKPTNIYDFSKFTIDGICKVFSENCFGSGQHLNYYGLRFGTVCGYSPNWRTDLMINKMVYTALLEKQIIVTNPFIERPILGLNDLVRSIETIIYEDKPSGVYNIASFNTTILNIANQVGKFMKVPIKIMGENWTYNFRMSTELFEQYFDFEFKDDINSIINDILLNKQNTNYKLNDRV